MMTQTEMGCPDFFEMITGPGDGIDFPVTRTPVDIGSGQECGVHLQFDRRVHQTHARVTVVSEGYRIRHLHGGPVYVNGKRAGRLRSRIARTGNTIRVGDTDLLVQCTPDGLASRSHGMPLESDAGHALRLILPALGPVLAAPVAPLKKLVFRRYRLLIPLAIIVGVVWFFRPDLVELAWNWAKYWFLLARWYINHFIRQLMGQLPGITVSILAGR